MAMATALHHLSGFGSPRTPLKLRPLKRLIPVAAVPISNAQTRERMRMKELFREARERCISDPMDGVSFTLEDFHRALDRCGVGTEVGCKVKGTVILTDAEGAFVDISAKSSAFLPLHEASICKVKHVSEAGIYPGLQEEFLVIGGDTRDDKLIISLRLIQSDLAWERCQQLQAKDVVIKGKVIGRNKGGLLVFVEGLQGFVPFSELSMKSSVEEHLNKELPLKFLNVDKKQSQLVLSNCKAIIADQPQFAIGSVVIGTVCSLKQYGALVDVGGLLGLLHVSQISHDLVSDITAILQPGDIIKVMIISHDHERERLSLSTKKLEPNPGDMIRNPKLVFEKADETAKKFEERIAWIEQLACTGLIASQSEDVLS